jgi:hypothetical protein
MVKDLVFQFEGEGSTFHTCNVHFYPILAYVFE